MVLLLMTLALSGGQDQAAALLRQADGYRSSRQYDRAIVEYTEAIRLQPALLGAYFNRALTYEAMGHDKNALEDFSTVIAFGEREAAASRYIPAAFERRATVHFRMGAFGRSAADYQSALAIDPRNAQALYGRAVVQRLLAMGPDAAASAGRDIADATSIAPGIAAEMAARGVK